MAEPGQVSVEPAVLAVVAELTTPEIIATLLAVPAAERGRWRWRITPEALVTVRGLPEPAPQAGPICVLAPSTYDLVKRADETRWLLGGRPVVLTDDGPGLELVEVPPEQGPAEPEWRQAFR